jgi:hypothetical protein
MKKLLFTALTTAVCAVLIFSCAGGPKKEKPGATPSRPALSGNAVSQSAFFDAIEANNVDEVRRLMDSGQVDMYMDVPGAGSTRPMPILLWAINTNRSLTIITEIVDYYTEPLDELVDREGRNAWYYATLRKNAAVQKLLQQKGITTDNAANTQG